MLPGRVKARNMECAWACVLCCHSTVLWHSNQQAKGHNISAIVACYHTIRLNQLQHACCLSWGGGQLLSMTPARKVLTLLLGHICIPKRLSAASSHSTPHVHHQWWRHALEAKQMSNLCTLDQGAQAYCPFNRSLVEAVKIASL